MQNSIIIKLINMSIKLFSRLLVICFFSQAVFAGTVAQKVSNVIVSVSIKNESLEETFKKIEELTDFNFAFSQDILVNFRKKMFIEVENKSLKEVLENISYQTGLTFKQINRTISVKANKNYYPDVKKDIVANGKIIGVVTVERTGEPLLGANILISGTNIGAATDLNGAYELFIPETMVDDDATIVVKYIGFKAKSEVVTLTLQTLELNFQLQEDIFLSEEVVVTGIASKTSKAVAEIAISRINADDLTQKQAFQDVSQLLSGKVAGVRIENTSGGPGSGTRFNVRSGGGLNGDGQPLIVIDGIRMENFEIGGRSSDFGNEVNGAGFSTLSEINPEDIEKIEVLKGPAAAASYGTNGSNGVILITTKRGQIGKGPGDSGISVSYKQVTGWNERADGFKDVYPYTYKKVHSVFQDGPINQNSLSISGGIPTLRYRVSFDKRDEDGILPNQYLNKNTYRANIDALPSDKVTLSVSTSFSESEQRRTEADNNTHSFVYNTSREPTWNWADSSAILARKNIITNNRFLGSFQGTYKPIDALEIRAVLGMDYSQIKDLEYTPPGVRFSKNPKNLHVGNKDVRQRKNTQFTYNLDATYKVDLMKDLNLTSIVGAQLFEKKWESFAMETDTFATPLISDLDAGADFNNIGESFLHLRNGGIFTEHSFAYDNIYRLSLMLRKDYASTIGVEAPSIIYPKASLSIRLDKFGFFPKSIFNLFKIRAAYGETGKLPGSRYAIRLLWEAQRNPYGVGARLDDIGNEKIEPERIKEFEVGFDTEIFNNYAFEFTYYKSFASNSIVRFANAPSTGLSISSVPKNIGEVEGWGIETLLSGRPLSTTNFQLDFTIVNSYQDNEVIDLGGSQPIFAPSRGVNVIKEGLPQHAFYAYKLLGAKFDENGVYDGPQYSEEKEYLGTPIPTYTGSFSLSFTFYKRLNLYIMGEWATGHSVLNYTQRQAIRDGNGAEIRDLSDKIGVNPLGSFVDWFPDRAALTPGTSEYIDAANKLAKLYRTSKSTGGYIEPADFIKLREISLSYDLTDHIKYYIGNYVSGLTIGLSARNIWTSSKYSGIDPELNAIGVNGGDYGIDFYTTPLPRTYNFWFRITL